MWESRTMEGTSIVNLAEWKTVQSSRTATGFGTTRQQQNDGTTIRDEGQRLVVA